MIRHFGTAEPYLFVGDVATLLMELGDRPHLVYRPHIRWWLIVPIRDGGAQVELHTLQNWGEPTPPPPVGQWSYYYRGFWGWAKEAVGVDTFPVNVVDLTNGGNRP